jgi:DNA-binding Lrp family transcriptional regulator
MERNAAESGESGRAMANFEGRAVAEYDDLDRGLVHALQIDGRAAFSTIAQVLGISDKTVARRYARLRTAGLLRVVGVSDSRLLGESMWFLRVRSSPASALSIAAALAKRPDTSWVRLTSGGTEIVCAVRTSDERASRTLLLDRLPRTPHVEAVTAHCVVHQFFGGPTSLITKHGPLDEGQIGRLRAAATTSAPVCGRVVLDATDISLLKALAVDGRESFEDLSAAAGASASTVRRRLTELREHGLLYFDVEVDWHMFGLGTRTMLWLAVDPAHLDAAGKALADHPEAAYVAATTGPASLYATITCPDYEAFYTYLTGRIAAVPGITHVESAPIIRTMKRSAGQVPTD